MTKLKTITEAHELAAEGLNFKSHYRGTVVAAIVADHGVTDAKGRAIGGIARIFRFIPAGTTTVQYGVLSYATRNREQFGAVPTRWASVTDTLDAALDAAEVAMIAQFKRYMVPLRERSHA